MSLTIASNPTRFNFVSRQIIYVQGMENPLPYVNGVLAPSTATDPTYQTGTLLAKYDAHAPTPALVGTYVNYDPASANLDQKVCVGVLAVPNKIGLSGVDLTSPNTEALTVNRLQIALFQNGGNVITGWLLNEVVLTDTTINAPAVIVGFNATYNAAIVSNNFYNGVANNIITVSSIK